ncbi:F-type H+-transporting ATPase subunit b [Bacillus horti]|uniref:ATP synthase subunit b n=2 Tax=Caldalkalibacillus horti TaxID=77523 RepID=A0ABT9VZQ7_9BACI|nr:F-type H+-transporting ATPase subunit b [Bacillus horti]
MLKYISAPEGTESAGFLASVEWGTMLYSLFIFILLFLLLRKFAFGPLMKVMEERQEKISADIATAEENRLEAQRLLSEQEAALEAARADAKQILDNARATSEKQAEQIIQTAKQEIEQSKKVARAEIEREKEQAVEALRAQVGSLSVMLATKVIEKELDAQQQEKLIENYLKEVGNKQ